MNNILKIKNGQKGVANLTNPYIKSKCIQIPRPIFTVLLTVLSDEDDDDNIIDDVSFVLLLKLYNCLVS